MDSFDIDDSIGYAPDLDCRSDLDYRSYRQERCNLGPKYPHLISYMEDPSAILPPLLRSSTQPHYCARNQVTSLYAVRSLLNSLHGIHVGWSSTSKCMYGEQCELKGVPDEDKSVVIVSELMTESNKGMAELWSEHFRLAAEYDSKGEAGVCLDCMESRYTDLLSIVEKVKDNCPLLTYPALRGPTGYFPGGPSDLLMEYGIWTDSVRDLNAWLTANVPVPEAMMPKDRDSQIPLPHQVPYGMATEVIPARRNILIEDAARMRGMLGMIDNSGRLLRMSDQSPIFSTLQTESPYLLRIHFTPTDQYLNALPKAAQWFRRHVVNPDARDYTEMQSLNWTKRDMDVTSSYDVLSMYEYNDHIAWVDSPAYGFACPIKVWMEWVCSYAEKKKKEINALNWHPCGCDTERVSGNTRSRVQNWKP